MATVSSNETGLQLLLAARPLFRDIGSFLTHDPALCKPNSAAFRLEQIDVHLILRRTCAVPTGHEKFKALAQYICWRYNDDPARLGAVKLNKALWLCDFTAYYKTGHSITGARYIKRQYGPVPSAIQPTLRELEQEGALTAIDSQFHGYKKKEFRVNSKPDMSLFDDNDIGTIEAAIRFVCDEHTAKSISDLSHDRIWQTAQDGEEIPYFTVFSVPGSIGDDEREWARLELETIG